MKLALVLLAAAAASTVHLAPPRPGYAVAPNQLCDGYPRLPIETAKGMCGGLVYGPPPEGLRPSQRLIRLPRTLLFLRGGDLLVVDLGGWETRQGAVWRLNLHPGSPPHVTKLLSGLVMPHTAAIGPDGGVYIGEMGRIFRFNPDSADPAATVETVVANLPSNHLHEDRHPLSSFIFDADGSLLVNVGAPSDQCTPQQGPSASSLCDEVQGDPPLAAVWRFEYLGNGHWEDKPKLYARGLRNSIALVRHASGTILQAENGIDVDDPAFPYEAINRLVPGGDYGWPYCVEAATPAPLWTGANQRDCKGDWRRQPLLFLPPHGAPLSLLYYHGGMFPELEGNLIVTLHGFRATGSRILAFPVDAKGEPRKSQKASYFAYSASGEPPTLHRYRPGPSASGLILTPRWDALKGVRPAGAPVGLAISPDGALWVAEDRNGTIIRFSRDAPPDRSQGAGPSSTTAGHVGP